MQKSDDEWKKELTPEQYKVLRCKGTEAPFSGKYLNHNEKGMYTCAACGTELFADTHKYESTVTGLAGWPSFADVAKSDAVEFKEDTSLGMNRTEVICKNCGSHLGHLFDDATSPSGAHYCINSAALDFNPSDTSKAQ